MARPPKPRFAPQRWWSHPYGGHVWSLATHPDHDAVLAGGETPHDALWSLVDGRALPLGDVPSPLRDAAWIDATTVALVVEDGDVGDPRRPASVLVRDLTGAAPDRVVARLPDAGFRTQITVDRAGRHAVVNTSHAVHLVSLRDDAPPRDIETFQGDRAGVICGALSPDGTLCLAARASVDGVRLYDVASGARVRDLGGGVTNGVVAACFDPSGTLAAALTLSERCHLVVWNVSDGSVRFVREGGTDAPPALAFSPDGSRLAVSVPGHRVVLLDTRDGRAVAQTKTLDGNAFRLAFARDGSTLYVADNAEVHTIPVTGAAPAAPTQTPGEPRGWTTLHARNGFRSHTGGCIDAQGNPWIVGQNGSVFHSADDGLTWAPLKLGKKPYLTGACQAADGAIHLFGMGVVVTTRGGDVSITSMPGRDSLTAMASSPAVTVASSLTRIYLRAAGTDAWIAATPPSIHGGWHQAMAVDDRGVFYLVGGCNGVGSVASSSTPGESWVRAALDGCGPMICVACDGERVYAGGEGGALYRSDDRGAHWERLPSPVTERTWQSLVVRGDVVYAATARAVYRSDDGGRQWQRVLRGDVQRLLWTPRGRVIAVGDGPIYGCVDVAR
jgi:hypothetical protein